MVYYKYSAAPDVEDNMTIDKAIFRLINMKAKLSPNIKDKPEKGN